MTDVHTIWQYYDNFSDEGLVLLQNVYDQTYTYKGYTVTKSGWSIYGADFNANENFRWVNLIADYLKYGRVLLVAEYGEPFAGVGYWPLSIVFESTGRVKEGVVVSYQECCKDDGLYSLYRTEIGDGYVEQKTKRLKDGKVDLLIRYKID